MKAKRLFKDKGVTAVLVAICLVVFIGFIALAIDIGYTLVARTELQKTADAAALAAARQLGVIYEGMSYEAQQSYDASGDDADLIKKAATDVASKNKAAGASVVIELGDIKIGRWVPTKSPKFTQEFGTLQPDAVQVAARRDSNEGSAGPISTFFAGVMGISTVNVSAIATAALTGQSKAGPGGLPIPVGISKERFNDPDFCNKEIHFYPTNDPLSCGGWHTYKEKPSSENKLEKILDGLTDGTFQSPETFAGETLFNFTGGTLAAAFDKMKALFDAMRVKNDGKLDNDTDPNTWTATVPVYDSPDCSNPNQSLKVVGFAEVKITDVLEAPEKIIKATIKCDYVEAGRGGGGEYGTKGSIPNLVQ